MSRWLVRVVALLVAALLAGCGDQDLATFTRGRAVGDVTYCNGQTLDLYLPRVAGGHPLPLALYVHGGGMTGGGKSDLDPQFLDALAEAGYAVASMGYRLAPRFRWPAQIEDVKCAVRFLRARAGTYGLDGRDIFAFGTSVGGQLVALAALTGGHSAFDVGDYPGESSEVSAVADMFGPANLTEPASGFSASGLRDVFGTDTAGPVEASPTHYVAPGSPPILIIQGVEDVKVLPSQALELATDLRAAGDPSQLVLVHHMGHMFQQVGSQPIDPSQQQIAHDMVGFFDTYRAH